MTKRVELFSGKVLKVPSNELSSNRYKWLKLSEAEPDFGTPDVDGAFIYSDQDGTRRFTSLLTTDEDGNLRTAGVSITGNRIEATTPGENLELGTTDDENLNVRITSNLLVEGDVVINGTFTTNVELDEITLADGATLFIGTDPVLNQTTLGPSVIESSLETVGVIREGTWQGDIIGTEYGGTGIGGVGVGVPPNAILYGNGVNPMGQATGTAFQVLQLDASGTPVFGALDAGGY
jgi:hypothetical protein